MSLIWTKGFFSLRNFQKSFLSWHVAFQGRQPRPIRCCRNFRFKSQNSPRTVKNQWRKPWLGVCINTLFYYTLMEKPTELYVLSLWPNLANHSRRGRERRKRLWRPQVYTSLDEQQRDGVHLSGCKSDGRYVQVHTTKWSPWVFWSTFVLRTRIAEKNPRFLLSSTLND